MLVVIFGEGTFGKFSISTLCTCVLSREVVTCIPYGIQITFRRPHGKKSPSGFQGPLDHVAIWHARVMHSNREHCAPSIVYFSHYNWLQKEDDRSLDEVRNIFYEAKEDDAAGFEKNGVKEWVPIVVSTL